MIKEPYAGWATGDRWPVLSLFLPAKGFARPIFTLLILFVTACSPTDAPESPKIEDLSLVTRDGLHLAATLYPAADAAAPGLILIHGRSTARNHWSAFARRSQRKGYTSIAFDLRGHGESARQSGEAIDPKTFTKADWLAAGQDIEAAHEALVQRGVNAENVAAVGADVGANLLMHYALQHRQIQGVVLVSPGLDYEGIELEPTMETYGNRPSMVVFTSGDAYAASSAQRLHHLAQGYAELREYQGSAHGIDVFERSGHAADQILLWLQSIIGPPA